MRYVVLTAVKMFSAMIVYGLVSRYLRLTPDGDSMFLQSVGVHLQVHTASTRNDDDR
jgi:hypothetical protein